MYLGYNDCDCMCAWSSPSAVDGFAAVGVVLFQKQEKGL